MPTKLFATMIIGTDNGDILPGQEVSKKIATLVPHAVEEVTVDDLGNPVIEVSGDLKASILAEENAKLLTEIEALKAAAVKK